MCVSVVGCIGCFICVYVCVCTHMHQSHLVHCALLQCARGVVQLELGRLKAASWISSRRTSQGSQVCKPGPGPPHWAFPELPLPFALELCMPQLQTQTLTHYTSQASALTTPGQTRKTLHDPPVLCEKVWGICVCPSAFQNVSFTSHSVQPK